MRPNRLLAWGLSAAAVAGTPAAALTGAQVDAVRRLAAGPQQASAGTRLRATVADLSAPLDYMSRAGPLDPSRPGDPRLMDVAGVRVGMSPEQADAALQAAGFEPPRALGLQPSYDTRVRNAWNTSTRGDTGRVLTVPASGAWRKPGEEVELRFEALPEGARVSWIAYRADAGRVGADVFERQLLARYGPPANGEAEDQRWCTLRAPACEDPRNAHYPVMEASAARRTIWVSGADDDRAAALRARFAADAARRSAAPVQASF